MAGETLRIRRQATQGNLLFGEYTLLRVLAQGPISLVCEAEHNSLKRRCALKTVHPDHGQRHGAPPLALVDAFLREARIMAAMDNPHVVPVYHAGTVGPDPFIAMRLIAGGTLSARLHGSGAASPDWAMRLLRGCADGLRALHAVGYLHGSVRAEHILLEPDDAPRLAGFDRAMPITPAAQPPHPLPDAAVAPEWRAGETLDQRADLYALGATIALALGLPVDGLRPDLGAQQIAIAVMAANPHASRAATLAPLARVLAKCLAAAPDARYASSEQLIDDARRVSEGGEPAHALGRALPRKEHFVGTQDEDASPFPP
jgi:serine/threonine protein kinase